MKEKRKKKKSGSRAADIASLVVLIISIVVFIGAGYRLGSYLLENKKGQDEYAKLAALIPTVAQTESGKETDGLPGEENEHSPAEESSVEWQPEEGQSQEGLPGGEQSGGNSGTVSHAPVFMENVDWQQLYLNMHGINPDYQGWIYISETNINYPIVQGTDNEYYLHHTFYGEDVFAGSIFIDSNVEGGIEGKNVIIYGHNMKLGTMFANLKKFKNQSFYERHQSFSVYTATGIYEYRIFAKYTTSPDSATYTYAFGSDENFMNYINMVKSWSDVDTGVEVSADDTIITLSTCVNNNKDRYVVHAKRIK